MKWFDGFPFKSREKMKREQDAFEKRIFPFGQPQKEAAQAVLDELMVSRRPKGEERLYAFVTAKDQYTEYAGEEDKAVLLNAAAKALRDVAWMRESDRKIVLALVQLDTEIASMEEYPTAQMVTELAEKEEA